MTSPSPPPAFTRSGTSPLYWLDQTRTCGFLADAGGGLGSNPTLPETWSEGDGVYFFLGAAPTADGPFLDALQEYVSSCVTLPPRFVWVVDPAPAVLQWRSERVATRVTGGIVEIAQPNAFDFWNWSVVVRGGASVDVGEGDAGWGFLLGDPAAAPAAALLSPNGLLETRAATSMLSLEASSAGCWSFTVDAPPPGDGTDVFETLACAIRYFAPDPDTHFARKAVFPVLAQPPTQPLTFTMTFDPLRPLVAARSRLAFANAPLLDSGFVTATGWGVALTPALADEPNRPALSFELSPVYIEDESSPTTELYTSPAGAFDVSVLDEGGSDEGLDRLVCGASALEYVGLPETAGSTLIFTPGQNAFAPLTATSAGEGALLTGTGTTSWVNAQTGSTDPIYYYAQPTTEPFFYRAPDVARGDDAVELLDYLEIPAAELGSTALPMAPFRGVTADDVRVALEIEQGALAPARAAQLSTGTSPVATDPIVAVTPLGTAAGVTQDTSGWAWLGLGLNSDQGRQPDVVFTSVTGRFRQAMLTKDLFMVLGNEDEFVLAGSIRYQLDAGDLALIGQMSGSGGVRPSVLAQVKDYFDGTFPLCDSLGDFQASLREASAGITGAELHVFQSFAGLLTPEVDRWSFQLSPEHWAKPENGARPNTYIVYKLGTDTTLRDLVEDTSAWSWPEASSRLGPAVAAKEIAAILDKAIERADAAPPGVSPYCDIARMVRDERWTGVLALSVSVPFDQVPAELQALAAGIDADKFYAHHLGLTATPFDVDEEGLTFARSTWFGLLDYESPEDQSFDENTPFAFKVMNLTLSIRNSVVSGFSSRAELLVNRLFGVRTRMLPAAHGNNVILDGSFQKQTQADGTTHDAYVFEMNGFSDFQLGSPVIDWVELTSTQLVASRTADPEGGSETVEATFQMAGNLRFYDPAGFDPFCWGNGDDFEGHLRFGNLAVVMTFDLGNPAGTTVFTLRDGDLSFDLANSRARPDSLVNRFPARLGGLITTPDPKLTTSDSVLPAPTPADLGFVSVSSPLQQSEMTQPWYGLRYTVDLGTLGALAAGTGLSLEVLAAWSASDGESPEVYLGIKVPGAKDVTGVGLPLEGLLTMGFRSIGFVVGNGEGGLTYALVARGFAIKFLGLAFPPGRNELYLFGNPSQGADAKAGWYAAYAPDAKKDEKPALSARSLTRSSRARELR